MKGQVMTEAPQDSAAALYMSHKGYASARPYLIEKLEEQPCWYFYYQLPEGSLELEVYWNQRIEDWECQVTSFSAD